MSKISFIVNSKNSRKCKKFDDLIKFLKLEHLIELKHTISIGDGISKAREASDNGADIIVAVGGDGTINEVANGIMLSRKENKPLMGIMLCGTGNDFLRSFQIRPIEQMLSDIRVREIDLGLIKCKDKNKNDIERYFVNIGDIGVSALTVQIVNGSKKRLGSALTFFVGVLRAFSGYKHNEVHVKAKEFEYSGKITTVVFANGQYFGGGIGIAPNALLDDGYFDVTLVGNIKTRTFLKYFPSLRKKDRIEHKEVFYYKTQEAFIKSLKSVDYPIEADGEFLGFTPLNVKLIKNALKIIF